MYKNIATYKTKNTKTPFCREREKPLRLFVPPCWIMLSNWRRCFLNLLVLSGSVNLNKLFCWPCRLFDVIVIGECTCIMPFSYINVTKRRLLWAVKQLKWMLFGLIFCVMQNIALLKSLKNKLKVPLCTIQSFENLFFPWKSKISILCSVLFLMFRPLPELFDFLKWTCFK